MEDVTIKEGGLEKKGGGVVLVVRIAHEFDLG